MEFLKNVDGLAGKCGRCNRKVSINGYYAVREGVTFGPECVAHYDAVKHLFEDPKDVLELTKTQFRLKMGILTKAGLAKKKALANQTSTDFDPIAMGM